MAELKTLVEREMDRAGSPSYSFEDLARRRHRKQRNRRLGTMVLALALAAAAIGGAIRAFESGPVPTDEVTPTPVPFVGTWESTDPDGSHPVMSIRDAGDGTYDMSLYDDAATVCDGAPATVTGIGRMVSGTEMTVTQQVLRCLDGSEPTVDGEPLTDLNVLTLTYYPETDTLYDSFGIAWNRPGSDPAVVPWPGIWPQDTREEAEEAQRRADAGDPEYTWQLEGPVVNVAGEDVLAPIATRFLEEELGWTHYSAVARYLSDRRPVVPGGSQDLVLIRCEPEAINPLYLSSPDGRNCAPTIDLFHYETVLVKFEQLVRSGRTGIWIVTDWRELPDSDEPIRDDADWFSRQYEQVVPPTEAQLRGFVEAFLEARVAGRGAEEYLVEWQRVGDGAVTSEVPLMYETTGGHRYERFELGSVSGPQWPDGAYRVTVRLFADADAVVVEQDFTIRPDEGELSAEVDLEEATTQNGAPVPFRYGILGGRVTFEAGEPWLYPSAVGVVESEEAILGTDDPDTHFVVIEAQAPEPPCAASGSPGSAQELAARILDDTELDATALQAVTLGGVRALRVDVAPAAGAQICGQDRLGDDFDRGVPVVMRADGSHAWSVDRGERMRVHLLDFPGEPGRTLAVLIVAPEDDFDQVLAAAAPILQTIELNAG